MINYDFLTNLKYQIDKNGILITLFLVNLAFTCLSSLALMFWANYKFKKVGRK
jgi:hypothetical protein